MAVVYQDAEFLAFLDHHPIREGHVMIIPRAHYAYFDDLPEALAAQAMILAQRLSRTLKAIYGVERVALAATGSDLPHAHLHVVPMHEKTDITSARYMAEAPVFAQLSPVTKAALAPVAARIAAGMEA